MLPAHVKGNLFVTITIEADGSGANAATNDTTIKIYHYDGTTETQLGSTATLPQLENPASTAADQARHSATFAVDKVFKKGDILRVEVISTIASANANSTASHYHDGANRDLSLTDQFEVSCRSDLIVQTPFQLSL